MHYHDCHHWNSHKKGVPLWDKSMLWTSYPSCFFDGNCPPSLHSRIPKSHWYWSPRLRQKPSRRRESLLCVEKTVSKPSMSMGFLKHSILGIHRKGYLSFTPALVQHWTNQLLPEPGSPSGVRFYGSLGVPILDQNYPLAIKDDKPKNLWFWHQRAPCTSRFTSTGHQRATYRASVSDCHRWPSKNGISHHLARIDLEKWGATKWMTKYDKGFLVMGQSSFIFMGNFPSFLGKGWSFWATLKQAQRQIKTQGQVIRPVQRQAPGGKGAVPVWETAAVEKWEKIMAKLGWKSYTLQLFNTANMALSKMVILHSCVK